MKAVLAVVLALALATAAFAYTEQEYEFMFSAFMKQHQKTYTSDEFLVRYNIFRYNIDRITEHNKKNASYTLGMNQFGDLTHQEFLDKVVRKGYRRTQRPFLRSMNAPELVADDLPESIDWRKKGAVTAVKNQEQCGSCWSFSTTGSVEGIWAIKTGKLVSLSEQYLMDCSKDNAACNGGQMDLAFEFIIKNKGICSEASYPYTAHNGTSCKPCQKVAHITGYKDVPSNNEDALKAAVAKQPVSIAIEADQQDFQFYSGGVFDKPCGTNLDHGVLIVGYGNLDGKDYWIVKNSWGATWGDSGYILLERGSGSGSPGKCGLAMAASYATLN